MAKLTVPHRVDINSEQLRGELADALGIPAPYVDIYGDRIEVVGMVDETMQTTTEATVAAHVAIQRPDVPGFLIAVMGSLGKPRGREILATYPDIHMALREPYNYTIARQGIDEALADGFLTQAEHDTIMGAWDTYHLPPPPA